MHIILGFKKRYLGPASAGAAATGEAPSMPATKKPTAKEMREAEKQAGEEQEREHGTNSAIAIARKERLLPLK